MPTTTVLNLMTGDEQVFMLEPPLAVRNAYLQSRGDFNTWDYDKRVVPLVYGKWSVRCGNFAALLPKELWKE